MKYRATKLFGIFATFATLITTSCKEYTSIDYTEVEQKIFDDWVAENKPLIVDNYQEDGGYYIDLVSAGDTSSRAIGDTICWVQYDLTGYDLWGNVSITRNDVVAWQQGSFSKATHYVPYLRLSDAEITSALECTQKAFSNSLKIGTDTDVLLYNGAEFTIYSPSSLVGTGGTTGTGGYEGQYSLGTLPFIGKIKVTNVIYNPVEYEEGVIDAFATINGGLTINPESLDKEEEESKATEEDKEEEEEEEDPNAWTNSVDSLGYLYVNKRYTPNVNGASFVYENPYVSTVPSSPYTKGMSEVDKLINKALEERFPEHSLDGELVGDEGVAKIWYIGRFVDGFIFDTNIDEVKEIIYGKVEKEGSVISYDVSADEKNYITAWYHTIPYLRYGQWASMITVSAYAYGSIGMSGSTSSSTTSSNNYYDYYNYYNGYNSYYNNYYYNGYSPYYNNYYNSNYYSDTSSTTTTTTISTEIPSYSPLIFEIYIEPEDEE